MQTFLDGLDKASKAGAEREYAMILDFAKQQQPSLEALDAAQPGLLAGAVSPVGI